MRIQREEDSSQQDHYVNPMYDWRSLNKTSRYDERTKMDLIKLKSKHMDDVIKFKEKQINYSAMPIEETNKVNYMLVDSIEAKLAILDKLQSRE